VLTPSVSALRWTYASAAARSRVATLRHACPVLQDEGVVPLAADRRACGKPRGRSPHTRTRRLGSDRETGAPGRPRKKKSRCSSGRLLLPLGFGVEAVEDRLPRTASSIMRLSHRRPSPPRRGWVRQEEPDAGQRHLLVGRPGRPNGQDQTGEAGRTPGDDQVSDGASTPVAARLARTFGLPALERRCCPRPSSRTLMSARQRRHRREVRRPLIVSACGERALGRHHPRERSGRASTPPPCWSVHLGDGEGLTTSCHTRRPGGSVRRMAVVPTNRTDTSWI